MCKFVVNVITLFSLVISAICLSAISGCATTAQIPSVASAADVVETGSPNVTEDVDTATEPDLGIPLVPNGQVSISGTVLEDSMDSVEIRLADGRRVRVTTLTDGSVAWHVVGAGVSTGRWQAPANSMLEYGRGVDSRGVTLSLPEPAVRQLERDLAAR